MDETIRNVWWCSVRLTIFVVPMLWMRLDPNVCLSALLDMFCLCYCMSEVISSFRSLRAESQVFALLMLFICVILHTMSSEKSLQLLCILPFGMLCLYAISMMFVKFMLAVCMLVGIVV